MSSFHKTSISHSSINGTKLKNNLPYISSGIPSLDFIIGGGLPAGTVFLVEEDVLGSYSRVLTKYFLAEGVVCKHDIFIASADENPEEIVKELPQNCTIPSDDKTNREVNGEMKIAWRYEGLGQVESSFGSNTNFGHHFDLSKHIDDATIKDTNITFCSLEQNNTKVNGFNNSIYQNLLSDIKKVVSKEEYTNTNKKKNILRISIQSLGSPIWMALDYDNESPSDYGRDLLSFLYCLRVLVRAKNVVVFITIPSHLFDGLYVKTSNHTGYRETLKPLWYNYFFSSSMSIKMNEDDHLLKRALYSVDNAVRIESFVGSSKETNPVYSEYHGLFHITKLSAVNSLVPYVPPSLDLAFKLKRKKFVIEKLHLPPELQESSEREQDDITATPKTCGGFKKKDIDF